MIFGRTKTVDFRYRKSYQKSAWNFTFTIETQQIDVVPFRICKLIPVSGRNGSGARFSVLFLIFLLIF